MARLHHHITNSQHIRLVKKLSLHIKNKVDGDRANNKYDSDDISEAGLAAELTMLTWLAKDQNDLSRLIGLWCNSASQGKNYGKDLLAEWFGISKNIEVKCSPVKTTDHTGVMYMRTPSEANKRKGFDHLHWSFWNRHLPDSYYVLLHQINKKNNFEFELVGWTTKERFDELYEPRPGFKGSEQYEKMLGDGYPTVCMHWQYLYCPDEFVNAVKKGKEPDTIKLYPKLITLPFTRKPPGLVFDLT